MNKPRLQALATMLRSVPPDNFNLDSWRYKEDLDVLLGQCVTDEQITSHTCGTTACAVGRACAMPEFNVQGLTYDNWEPLYTCYGSIRSMSVGWSAVEAFFDISYKEAQELFTDEGYKYSEYGDSVTPQNVAKRIEEFISHT